MPDDPGPFSRSQLSPSVRRIIEAGELVASKSWAVDEAHFLHALLCQVGLPRSKPDGLFFERCNGAATVSIQAGWLAKGGRFVQMPLPYGSRPRLVLIYLSTEAVRRNTRTIELGSSMRSFMATLGIDPGGREFGRLRGQMEALAACTLRLSHRTPDREVNVSTQPIERFEAWLSADDRQKAIWPAEIELSSGFYDTLREFAVPLVPVALSALKGSALALDIYAWLAHRLYRIGKPAGQPLSWANLRSQFGQEYADPRNFKKAFSDALKAVCAVYPEAKVEPRTGGILLRPSLPPVAKRSIAVSSRALPPSG